MRARYPPPFVTCLVTVAGDSAALALPIGAAATTGIETSTSVRILLTDEGAVGTPALSKLDGDQRQGEAVHGHVPREAPEVVPRRLTRAVVDCA
jgi:hypothetical protein